MCPSPSITLCIASPFLAGRKNWWSPERVAEQQAGVRALDLLAVVGAQTGHVLEDGTRRIGHERIVRTDDDALAAEDLEDECERVRREDEQVDEQRSREITRPYGQPLAESGVEVPHPVEPGQREAERACTVAHAHPEVGMTVHHAFRDE